MPVERGFGTSVAYPAQPGASAGLCSSPGAPAMKNRTPAVSATLTFVLFGCQPAVVTTPATQDKERDIHIRTPGANVDIEGKGKDRKVDVDVHRKDKNP